MRSCSSGVACTPDGAWVLVCSSAGLQVVDTATNKVVRTLSDLLGDLVAVSFDGKRAYVACDTLDSLAPRSYLDWLRTMMTDRGVQAGLHRPGDLADRQRDPDHHGGRPCRQAGRLPGLLQRDPTRSGCGWWTPSPSRISGSVSTEPSYSVGIGFVPNGTKAYVVCSADSGFFDSSGQQTLPKAPKAEDFFCAVIDTQDKEIVKRIPLEAY